MCKISICIPTYNGVDYIKETLNWVIAAINDNKDIEIVLNDDVSTDSTFNIIKEYEEKYSFIRGFQNKQNLGMDKNFLTTVERSSGEYVWLLGQDDFISSDAITRAYSIINNYEVSFIYWNYHFFNIKDGILGAKLNDNKSKYFVDYKDYNKEVGHAPSFLGANFMKREFYFSTDLSKYNSTYYIQMGTWLESMDKGKIYVEYNSKYIGCRMPSNSWKYSSPQMKFDTAVGTLYTYYLNKDRNDEYYKLYQIKLNHFKKVIIPRIFYLKSLGLKNKSSIISMITKIFDQGLKKNKLLLLYIRYPNILLLPLRPILLLLLVIRNKVKKL